MNELELFAEWFKKQTIYDIIHRKTNYSGRIPLSEVLKTYNHKRDDIIVECIISEELINKEGFNEERALCTAKRIMGKVKKLDEEAY